MRHLIIIVFIAALTSAAMEDDELCREKREIVSATMIHDAGGPRYICPNNYEIKGIECHKVDCQFEQTEVQTCGEGYMYSGGQCIKMYTQGPAQPVCPPGTFMENGLCTHLNTQVPVCPPGTFLENGVCTYIQGPAQVVCPSGTSMENGVCTFRVPTQSHTVTIDFVCPPHSTKDAINRKCIVTPALDTHTIVECPAGFTRAGNACYFQSSGSVSVVCPDGSPPVGGFCTIAIPDSHFQANCSSNARLIGTNICELLPVDVTVKCADGRAPDYENNCPVNLVHNITMTTINDHNPRNPVRVPEILYLCPYGFTLEHGECVMSLEGFSPEVKCPKDFEREGDACILKIRDKENYNVNVHCPPNSRQIYQKGCEAVYTGDMLQCERITQSKKCCKKPCGNAASSLTIHNINHVHMPTNISSTNINNIKIGGGSGSGNKTVVTQVEEEKEQKCCTVVSPRVCENHDNEWNCGHREYKRCGSMCTQDVIHLKAARPVYQQRMLVMPPPQHGMRVNRRRMDRVDCYGCVHGRYDCSPECFDHDCGANECNFMPQSTFCGTYGGEGCAAADGYHPFTAAMQKQPWNFGGPRQRMF